MKILVTAAGGFTGPHLLRHLAACGHEVTAIARRDVPLAAAGCRIVRADLSERLALDWRPDAIVHNAARIVAGERPAADLASANILATRNVVDFALDRGVESLIFLSSLSAFGRVRGPVVDEDTPSDSPAAYGLSKLYGERMLREVDGRLRSLSLRLPGILGPDCSGPWLAGVAARAREGQDIDIFNAGLAFNNALHVADLCRFVAAVLECGIAGADMVTLGTIDSLPLIEVVELIKARTGSRAKIVDRGAREGAFSVSTAKAERTYGFISMGIRETVCRYVNQVTAKAAA